MNTSDKVQSAVMSDEERYEIIEWFARLVGEIGVKKARELLSDFEKNYKP